MSMPSWRFDPETFAALWYGDANDRFPPGLRFRSRFPTNNEVAQFRQEVRASYDPEELAGIQAAMSVLSTSDTRIEILGWSSRHPASTGPDDVKQYRIIGARNSGRAVQVFQGIHGEKYGDIFLDFPRRTVLPRLVAHEVPPCPPGRETPFRFHPQDLSARAIRQDSPSERYQRLLDSVGDGNGIARLYVGPLQSRDRNPLAIVRWFDITGDGRYTESRGHQVTVRPHTPEALADRFATWLEWAEEELEQFAR